MIIQSFFYFSFVISGIYAASKYYDGPVRAYEFGFDIEGNQHRRESKDENGIVMGEFGFITGDGVYHVTVYATDENGNFKVISMKNYKRMMVPMTKAPQPSVKLVPLTTVATPPVVSTENYIQPRSKIVDVLADAPASNGASCSNCKIPEKYKASFQTTTTKPQSQIYQTVKSPLPQPSPPVMNKIEKVFALMKALAPPLTPNFKPVSSNGATNNQIQSDAPALDVQTPFLPVYNNQIQSDSPIMKQINDFIRTPVHKQQQKSSLQQQQQRTPLIQQQQQQTPSIQQQTPSIQQQTPSIQQKQQQQQQTPSIQQREQQQQQQQTPSIQQREQQQIPQIPHQREQQQQQLPQQSPLLRQSTPEQPTPTTNYANNNDYPVVPELRNNFQNDIPAVSTYSEDTVDQRSKTNNYQMQKPSTSTQTTGRAINSFSTANINAMEQLLTGLLYQFNYTVGYHGHHETGDRAGNKEGGYFVVGRDGYRRTVDYKANEFGYQPVIKYERVADEETPHENTEKDAGLKGYEFNWFYI